MPALLYYITDRRQFRGDAKEQERRLLAKIGECAAAGVDYIQLREKDLHARALEDLAYQAMAALRNSKTRLLINSRIDVALAAGAHGIHLPAQDLLASEARAIFSRAGVAKPIIGVSAHAEEEMAYAEAHGADLAVFAPVFEKDGNENPSGLRQLRQICGRRHAASQMPVFALGGVTLQNAKQCLEAGAAGIAGIRLLQENEAQTIVDALRAT
ncbi:MAG TPA: thiamine phosphate synthase [Candidatus Angelobacter sp.]|nr:thiamine phosphate synthase [Candidatus Angelobacter sp.]